jgi:hypothetical protein
MELSDYGTIIATQSFPETNITRHVIKNNKYLFIIDQNLSEGKNTVTFEGKDLKWVDTLLHDNLFRREIGKKTYYIKNGVVIVSEKMTNAKPIKTVKKDKSLLDVNVFATIDIETILVNNQNHPYLICGYSNGKYIHSYAKDLTSDSLPNLFHDFISQLLETFNEVKYVYAHNFSGFDGILLLNYLIIYPNSKVKPVIFNGKLMSIEFVIEDKKIIFKDSLLLLPLSLRKLCSAFSIESKKSYFPFLFQDINYIGALPPITLWPGISTEMYTEILNNFSAKAKTGVDWNFKSEAIKYCKLDCLCLYEILVKFNELIFSEFSLNIHGSLSL